MSTDSTQAAAPSSLCVPNIDKPLPPRPDSSLSHRGPPTPDLYGSCESDESVKSESPPWTPAAAQQLALCGDSEAESKRSSISSLVLEDSDLKLREPVQLAVEGITHHHPLARDAVSYIQSYSDISLQSDYYTHELLSQLKLEESPTFHNLRDLFVMYPNEALEILDLGCGRGLWAVETAAGWKDVHITAFDIVDLGRPAREWMSPPVAARITWKQGNFLTDRLPFNDAAFHFVRMSCLSSAIPLGCWPPLLKEIKRILMPGGRLELIDDEILFPEVQPPPPDIPSQHTPNVRQRSIGSLFDDTEDDTDDAGYGVTSPQITRPAFSRSPTSPNFKSPKSGRLTLQRSPASYSGGRRHALNHAVAGISDELGFDPWEFHGPPPLTFKERATNAKDMETIFLRILKENKIYPHPHKFLKEMLVEVFGEHKANCTHHFEIVLPTTDAIFEQSLLQPVAQSSLHPGTQSQTPQKDSPSIDERSTTRPTGTLPKAMRVLGETVPWVTSPLIKETFAKSQRYQPPGFVVLPNNVFVPCEPEVLEMHACKNVHLVLSSKQALSHSIREQYARHGGPTVSEDEFDHLMLLYDEFKRTRLGWPNRAFGTDEEDVPPQLTSATKQKFGPHGTIFSRRRAQSTAQPRPWASMHALLRPLASHELLPVRTIRVFQGIKPNKSVPTLVPLPAFKKAPDTPSV
ncbi:uncharacterized protein PHACADRAFT_190581 [Phanerochaete carnosa HHB-10118-sp]|uniref:Methyltransferase domain-containing protein n=1 Tax=Phanerochaete carnosa (strain HHB-10118-sp) TaxID=650164 RepID=K5WBV1_PHACS|nr:uncharacterized protein PHACADRAFT_190581 [Phanerochaete carnosa HHB-10118-sp]EKM61413.1 hypothetical protein PHACADRAFT_190581 [Phanerochaete carnosa HHB-10118-sp]